MNKIFPKIGLFLIILTNTSPAFAASRYQNLNSQANPQETIVALSFDDVVTGVKKIERIERQRREREQRAQERQIRLEMQRERHEQRLRERQAREKYRQRMREKYLAARRAAKQRQIQEARRRREYFNSLSPEQKRAYIRRQQALRQKQLEASLFLLGLFMSAGGSNSSQPTTDYRYIQNNPRPTYNPGSRRVKPIHPNYGGCHHYSC